MSDAPVHQPHDKLFKSIFKDGPTAAGFLSGVLPPALSRRIDWSSLAVQPGSFIDDQLKGSESDLLFRAGLQPSPATATDAPEAVPAFCYVLFEHQSEADPWLALRLLRYMVRIWEEFRRRQPRAGHLPPIVPVVLAQNRHRWELSPRFAALFAPPAGDDGAADFAEIIPQFTFRLIQLAELPFDKIVGTPAGVFALRVLKAERIGRQILEMDESPLWADGHWEEIHPDILRRLMIYLFDAFDLDKKEVPRMLKKIPDPTARTLAMSIAEQLRQEGRQEGRREGRQAGRQEGVLIGAIRTLQKALHKDVSPVEILAMQTLDQLQALHDQLERELG